MKKNKFSYTIQNHLASLLVERKVQKSYQEEKEVLLSEVEEELADYCELKRKSIIDIKRGVNQPSLPVAMQIAKFFGLPVEEIFVLKTKEELLMEKVEKIKMLMRRLDSEILGELHEAMEEYLDEVEKDFPDIANEGEDSTFDLVREFYMNLPASGYIDDTCSWLDNLQDKIEAEKELSDKVGH